MCFTVLHIFGLTKKFFSFRKYLKFYLHKPPVHCQTFVGSPSVLNRTTSSKVAHFSHQPDAKDIFSKNLLKIFYNQKKKHLYTKTEQVEGMND
jgi:hypothetical protein